MTIRWDESEPVDSGAYSQTANRIRSLKTDIATGLSQSMYFPGSGGDSAASAGQMKPGSFRAFHAAQSELSNPSLGTTGRLFQASDSSRLFGFPVASSTSTMLLGTARLIEGLTMPAQTGRWVLSSGTTTGDISAISFGVTYTVAPIVVLSLFSDSKDTAISVTIGQPTTVGVSIAMNNLGAAVTPAESILQWMSLGTAAF